MTEPSFRQRELANFFLKNSVIHIKAQPKRAFITRKKCYVTNLIELNEMNDRNRIKKKLIDTYMGDYRVSFLRFDLFFIISGEMSIKTNKRNLRTNAAARFRSGTVRSFVRIIVYPTGRILKLVSDSRQSRHSNSHIKSENIKNVCKFSIEWIFIDNEWILSLASISVSKFVETHFDMVYSIWFYHGCVKKATWQVVEFFIL